LPSRETRYARVRAYFGTISEPVFGDWSTTVEGTTERPPAPTVRQLNRPTRLDPGSRTRTSITLTWVDDANDEEDVDRYEVRQRPEDGSWGVANCGTSGEFVTTQRCVATGLEQGTDYDFGVRAHPDSDDDTKSVSPWSSTLSARTSGQQQEEEVAGGDDDLNITWKSTGATTVGGSDATITWSWDAADDRRIQYQVALLADPRNADANSAAARPKCPALTSAPATDDFVASTTRQWFTKEPTFAKTLASLGAGQVFGLCVVSTWDTDTGPRYGDVGLSWATTAPVEGTAADGRFPAGPKDNANKTTAIDWYVDRDAGFEYEVRIVSEGVDSSGLSCSSPEDGTELSMEKDSNGRYRLKAPKDYRRYAACVRATSGTASGSSWTELTSYTTLPGQVGTVSYLEKESSHVLGTTDPDTNKVTGATPVWQFSLSSSLPEAIGGYIVQFIEPAATKPELKDCTGTTGATTGDFTLTESGFKATGSAVTSVTASNKWVAICVRARLTGADATARSGATPALVTDGKWRIGTKSLR
ncbi:MAG: fibronectin type III domain-containing protein, partial [Thiotrichales bacterium]|nr:fibronectin type III domain-containing protein [Thiotrichales bacterium]